MSVASTRQSALPLSASTMARLLASWPLAHAALQIDTGRRSTTRAAPAGQGLELLGMAEEPLSCTVTRSRAAAARSGRRPAGRRSRPGSGPGAAARRGSAPSRPATAGRTEPERRGQQPAATLERRVRHALPARHGPRMAPAISPRRQDCSAAPRRCGGPGMPNTTAGRLVLGDRHVPPAAQGQQPGGAVVAHAGEEHADGPPAGVAATERNSSSADGRCRRGGRGRGPARPPSGCRAAGGRPPGAMVTTAGPRRLAGRRATTDRQGRHPLHPPTKPSTKSGWRCWTTRTGAARPAEAGQDLGQGRRPPVEAAMATTGRPVAVRVGGGRRPASGLAGGRTTVTPLSMPHPAAQLRSAAASHALGLGSTSTAPGEQGLDRRGGAGAGHRCRQHEDGGRAAGHDLLDDARPPPPGSPRSIVTTSGRSALHQRHRLDRVAGPGRPRRCRRRPRARRPGGPAAPASPRPRRPRRHRRPPAGDGGRAAPDGRSRAASSKSPLTM